uniref:ribonuclease H n=1 Tax=Albugo laibachii Nc14 TaxID=890382 RepID=F0WDJ0_9STRA|nr:ribonuclease putative [Albugo laibachii Nc14]|eukprot:CCA19264.1 ribonuclease putative [Albugo laibachii Nc14]
MGTRAWYYAVAVGRQIGIYTTWAKAEQQIKGVSNARFKKFASKHDAQAFISSHTHKELQPIISNLPRASCSNKRSISEVSAERKDADPTSSKSYTVFCDGSALNNGKLGCKAGYACIFPDHPDWKIAGALEEKDKDGKVIPPTNNRAEYVAALKALQRVNEVDPIQQNTLFIYSDSMLLIRSMTEWITRWKESNWRKKTKTNSQYDMVKNHDLLKALLETQGSRKIIWKHVRAHTGKTDWESTWNQVADDTAREAASG